MADLHEKFEQAGIRYEVQTDERHVKLYAPNGAVVGFWPNTGTCYAYGKSFKPSVENLIAALKSGRITMPADADQGECRSCGATIWWITTDKGKKMPIVSSGEPHFLDCPNAAEHRKVAR